MFVGQKVTFPYEEHGRTVYLACEVKELLPNGWVYVTSELRCFKAEEVEFLEGQLTTNVVSYAQNQISKLN